MKTKIITGVLLALAAGLLLWIDSAALWLLLAAAAALVGYYEACALLEKIKANLRAGASSEAAAYDAAPAGEDYGGIKSLGAALIIVDAIYLLISAASPLQQALISALVLASLAALFARSFIPALAAGYALVGAFALLELYLFNGREYLLWLIICVCACDSAAYFVGKAIGRRKFSPSSPNKTAEGVAGGLVAAAVLGALWAHFALEASWVYGAAASLALGAFGVFGDLFESRLKRLAGVKDSGSFLPGHGGVLDRLDALIFAAIFAVVAL